MKVTIMVKLLSILIIMTLIPLSFLGYQSLNSAQGLGNNAAEKSSLALKEEAETNMVRLVTDSASGVNDFFVEVEKDLEGFSKNVHMVYKDTTLYSTEYSGDTYAYWASSDWKDHTDKTRLTGILDGSITDANYDAVLALLNDTQETTFNKILTTLNSNYEVVEQPDDESQRFFPRFLVTYQEEGTADKTLFFDLKAIGDVVQASSTPFALNDFMYSLLDSTAKTKLNKALNMLSYGKSTVDTHDSYNNLRFGFWGSETDGVEMIYAGSGGKPLHPAAYGIGNCYYCKSPYALRDAAGTSTVWLTNSIDPESKVSTAIYPIYDTWGDATTDMIGFSEYWISWTTLSNSIVNTQYADTGYMFMIDSTGKIVSHPDSSMPGEVFGEDNNSDLDTIITSMKSGKLGYSEVSYNNKDVYLAYAPISTTGWSVGLIVPVSEIIQSAENIKSDINTATSELSTLIISITVISIILAIVIGFVFIRSVVQPIKELTKFANKLSNADLKAKAPEIKTNDEVKELSNAMNGVLAALKTIMDGK